MSDKSAYKHFIWLDCARGLALIAMAIYHFGWDLSFFGYVDSASVNDGPWKIFARCIASSFLILVGISFVWGHQNGINWRKFWVRWIKIFCAATLITLGTYFFTPAAFIFFGILHQIAFASLFGLLFLRLPWWALLTIGVAWVIGAPYLSFEILNELHLSWTGLTSEQVRSNDFVPVFPWFGAVLVGMGLGKFLAQFSIREKIEAAVPTHTQIGRGLSFLGRNSLITYLIHQPVIIGAIYVFSLVMPAQLDETKLRISFSNECTQSCMATFEATQCNVYCGCVEARLEEAALFSPVMRGEIALDAGEPAQILEQCSAEMIGIDTPFEN